MVGFFANRSKRATILAHDLRKRQDLGAASSLSGLPKVRKCSGEKVLQGQGKVGNFFYFESGKNEII